MVRPLIPETDLARRVREIGEAITRDYTGRELVVVSVLKGSFVFTADLVRAIDVPLRVEFFGVRSYGHQTESSGEVQITLDLAHPITGEDVLVVEDIVDTGLTLTYLLEQLRARGPRSVRVCALLHKPARSIRPVDIDYLGFTIEDVFVVGYGLDHAERYRNLPYVGVIGDGPDAAAG
ncbi:MAG TPA: hypoxanthine phosphoribosyltransferase [Polyangiaceae bacterium]|nr:hypoxanthine phosphoribosyltransferase [Polyangiaceae bacterium]